MTIQRTTLSRRSLLAGSVAVPWFPGGRDVGAQEGTPTPPIAGTTLRILMPRHPLSGYGDAIRNLATSWGATESVAVSVDIVPEEDLPATIERALASESGSGYDLIGTNLPLMHLAAEMEDLSGFQEELTSRFGPPAEPSDLATLLPNGRRPAISLAYAPAPLIYRRSIWERYGLPDGPATWQQLHETGSQIWHEEGMNVGLGLAREPGSERFAAMLLAAFGATMLDESGEIAINSPQTVDALGFAAELYRDAMSPESLDWRTDRPARLLADGIVSIICDDISAIRLAQQRNQEIADDLFLAPPPLGPNSAGIAASLATSYRAVHVPRVAANRDAALAFIAMLVESSGSLTDASQLSERPAYGSLVPELIQTGGWLDADPYGAMPPEKLSLLKTSAAWTTYPGAPGSASAIASRAHEAFLLSRMLARVAREEMRPEDAAAEAERWLRQDW